MNKPIVGIVGWKIGENSYGATVTHLEYIQSFGCVPRILMPWEGVAEDIDMLYLPGGADLYPGSYGKVPEFKTGNPDVYKQFFYDFRLKEYIESGMPIFGVCLGFQMINVFFGARIDQNLLMHPQSDERGEEAHGVNFTDSAKAICTISKSGRKEGKYMVNSHHHQGIMMQKLPEDIIPLAYYGGEEYGILEACIHRKYPIGVVQWHPEEFFDEFAYHLFKFILKKAIDRNGKLSNDNANANSNISDALVV